MSGFDKSKFLSLGKDIEEELTCGICLNVLNNPMTTPCCRHSYCKQCIFQSLSMSTNPNTCPNDRTKLLSKDLIPASRIVTNILDKQEVYCDYKSFGCPQTLQLGQLSQHLIQCMFDPNKASDKCTEALKGMGAGLSKLKSRITLNSTNKRVDKELLKEIDVLEKQLDVCQREVRLMTSKVTPKTVFIQPNTEEFKKEVIQSAKNNIESHEIINNNIEIQRLKKKVIKKTKEAIRQSDDFQQIGRFLVDTLNDDEYEWTVFVYPKNTAQHSSSNYSLRIELSFGDLSVLLIGHFPQEDDFAGDDYLDYSEDLADADFDDDDDEDEWEDWRAHINDQ